MFFHQVTQTLVPSRPTTVKPNVKLFLLTLLALFFIVSCHAQVQAHARELDNSNVRLVPHNLLTEDLDSRIALGESYEASFLGVERSIVGRQADIAPTAIVNNVGTTVNITPLLPQYFVFSNSSLYANRSGPSREVFATKTSRANGQLQHVNLEAEAEGEDGVEVESNVAKRQTAASSSSSSSSVQLFITANTCLQPSNSSASNIGIYAPQLQLWISTTSSNKNPGPTKTANAVQVVFDNGFANYTLNATSDVYIGIHAPNSTSYTSATYSVQIAASIDAPYHSYFYNQANPTSNLHLIDSDTHSALLVTDNLTSSVNDPSYNTWMNLTNPPFDVFVFNVNNTATQGLSNSYCALQMLSSAQGLKTAKSMTNITEGNLPKEQFYVTGLNGSSTYYGYAVLTNTSTSVSGVIGGGGSVWQNMTFSTQSDNTCSVIYNLSFCSTVAYAVPGAYNTEKFPTAASLALWYDNYTQSAYRYFDYAMQQIPCEIEADSQYSLAVTCDDCRAAYKAWLCSVSIPRCMDYTSTLPWLQERNVLQAFPNGTKLPSSITTLAQDALWWNSSRNPQIDNVIAPGPYKEVLPCDDLCNGMVQACPAALGFACPLPGQIGFEHAYGQRPNATNVGNVTCSFPGAVYGVSDAGTLNIGWSFAFVVAFGAVLWGW